MRYDNNQLIQQITTIVDNWQQRIDDSFFDFAARLLKLGKERCEKDGHGELLAIGVQRVCFRCGKVVKLEWPKVATKYKRKREE